MTKQWLHYSTIEPFLQEQKAMDALLKFLTEKLQKPQYLAFWFDVSQFEEKPHVKTALQIQEKYCVPNAFLFLQKVTYFFTCSLKTSCNSAALEIVKYM